MGHIYGVYNNSTYNHRTYKMYVIETYQHYCCCMNIAYLRRYYSLLLWITGCTDNVYVRRVIDPGAGGPPGSRLNPEIIFSYNEIFINDCFNLSPLLMIHNLIY